MMRSPRDLSHIYQFPTRSKTFQVLSIKDFLPARGSACTRRGVTTSVRTHLTPQSTTNDCAGTHSDLEAQMWSGQVHGRPDWRKEALGSDPVWEPQAGTIVFKMGNMATEIVAFLLSLSGWILVASTLPTDYWKVSSVDGTVITTATFWSNLWKTCVTDSTGVSNCKDFPSMLALDGEFRAATQVEEEDVGIWYFKHWYLTLVLLRSSVVNNVHTFTEFLLGAG